MEGFKGTKGPWNVQFGDEIYAGDGVDNEQVATANDCHDADLISAAPQLLEALQSIDAQLRVAWDEGRLPWNVIDTETMRATKAALNKALGQ